MDLNTIGNESSSKKEKNLFEGEQYQKLDNKYQTLLKPKDNFWKETPITITTDPAKLERYKAYGDKIYNKIGYNPLIDNEARFNANTTWYDDFKRTLGPMWDNTKLSFFNYDSDLADAQRMKRNMEIGSSSKEGFGASFNNTFLSAGYTFGIIGQMAVEELALGAITAMTGGLAAPATGSAAALRAGVAATKLGRAAQTSREILSALKKADQAKDYYNAVKMGTKASGKGLGGLFVPETAKLINNWDNVKDLNNLAKTSQSAMAFWRDTRQALLASSEADLEGWMKYDDVKNKLIDDYRHNNNGQYPDQAELEKIENVSKTARADTYIRNLPFIYLTDKITLGRAFKGIPNKMIDVTKTSGEFFDIVRKSGVKAGSKEAYELVENSMKETFKRTFTKANLKQAPIKTLAQLGKYSKENFAEGLQEWGQEVIGSASEQKALEQYRTGIEGSYNNYLLEAGKNFLSKEGLHTFGSGFLMGTIVKGPQVALQKTQIAMFDKLAQVTQGDQYKDKVTRKAEERKAMQDKVDILHEMTADPLTYFSERKEAYMDIATLLKQSEIADNNKDIKLSKDFKDAAHDRRILAALQNGTYDLVLEELEELSNVSEEDLREMYGNSTNVGKPLKPTFNKLVERAKRVKKNYDFYSSSLKNPIKLNPTSPTYMEDSYSYLAFERMKNMLIMQTSQADRTVERINDIQKDLLTDKVLKELEFFKVSPLFDVKSLESELEILESEVKSGFDSTPSGKKIQARKEKEFAAIKKYNESLKEYKELLESLSEKTNREEDVKQQESILKNLESSLLDYMVATSNKSKQELKPIVEKTLNTLLDHYNLSQDNVNLSRAITMLSDPATFVRQVGLEVDKHITQHLRRKIDIMKSLEYMREKEENNKMLIDLLDQKNVYIEEKDLDAYLDSGVIPAKLYDTKTGEEITDEKYQEILNYIKDYKAEPVEETDEETTERKTPKPSSEGFKITTSTSWDNVPQEVKQELADLHNEYKAEINKLNKTREQDGLSKLPVLSINKWFSYTANEEQQAKINKVLDRYNIQNNLTLEGEISQSEIDERKAKFKELFLNKEFIIPSDKDGNPVKGNNYTHYYNTKTKTVLSRSTTIIEEKDTENKTLNNFVKIDKEKGFEVVNGKIEIKEEFKEDLSNQEQEDVIRIKTSTTIGNNIDTIIRHYFAGKRKTYDAYQSNGQPFILTEEEFNSFNQELGELYVKLESNGETIYSEGIILYNDELKVAGTPDIVTIDKNGLVRIYDVKAKIKGVSMFDKSYQGALSDKDRYTEQLNTYRKMIEETHGLEVFDMKIIPVKVDYQPGDISTSEAKVLDFYNIEKKEPTFISREISATPVSDIEAKKVKIEKTSTDIENIENQISKLNDKITDLYLVAETNPNAFDQIEKLETDLEILKEKLSYLQEGKIERISINNINKGDLISLKNSIFVNGKVTYKSNKKITVQNMNNKKETIDILAENIPSKISIIDSGIAATKQAEPITKEEKTIISESKQDTSEMLNNTEATSSAIEEAKRTSQEEIDDEFLNDLGC